MQRTKSKLLSILLSLVMLLSLLPTTAFAASYAKISVNDILLGDNYYLKEQQRNGLRLFKHGAIELCRMV